MCSIIMGKKVPRLSQWEEEICHELTIQYSLICSKNISKKFFLDTNSFTNYLLGKNDKKTKKAPGMIATFWEIGKDINNLFHSMIVGVDDEHWIGSNNYHSFGIKGDRVVIDVSEFLDPTDDSIIRLAPFGIGEKRVYTVIYYTPETVAGFINTEEDSSCCRL